MQIILLIEFADIHKLVISAQGIFSVLEPLDVWTIRKTYFNVKCRRFLPKSSCSFFATNSALPY